MADDADGATQRKTGKLAALTATKGRIAILAGAFLLLAGGGAYAALQVTGGEPKAEEAHAEPAIPVPMPVASASEAKIRPSDYSIASVFDGEAFLVTAQNLVRARVGMTVPGLGTITAIDASPDGGGVVTGTDAILRSR